MQYTFPFYLTIFPKNHNKFHQEKGHYPNNLLKLYPEFIPEKSFISELKWKYRLGKKSYLLQKSVGKGQIVASMGPDLKLKTEEGAALIPAKMVASVNKSKASKQPVKKTKLKPPQQSPKKIIVNKAQKTKPDVKENTEDNQLAKLLSQNHIKISGDKNSGTESKPSKSNLLSTIVKKELNKNEKYRLAGNSYDFYIWKSPDGYIGFSNMRYPDKKNLAIYKDQSWIQYIE